MVTCQDEVFAPPRRITKPPCHMKKLLFAFVLLLFSGLQLVAQEHFRFDSIRLEFINQGFHVMIGDSTGMNDTANARTIENTFIGHRAGSLNRANRNSFVGTRAGEHNIKGWENVFIGAWAGRWDSIGQCNTYVGADAGSHNKAGWGNTFLGYGTGMLATGGINNVFIGYCAGLNNVSGEWNAFLGYATGYNNTTGSENTFLGNMAGRHNFTGHNNTYIGQRAGRWNEAGSGNLFLGSDAGANEAGSGKLYLSNSDTNSPLVYGEFDNKLLKLNAETRVVDHDVVVTDPTKGIILKSPNGNCWRIRVMDNGTLITEQVSPCPQ